MKKILLFTFIMGLFLQTTMSQELPECKLRFELPNDEWSLMFHQTDDDGIVTYVYNREPVTTAEGVSFTPYIGIIIEDLEDEDTDVITFSIMKRFTIPFEVINVFIHESGIIDYTNAIGYKGTYVDEFERTLYWIHAINGTKGIQFIFESSSDTFELVDEEFLKSIKSIRVL